MSHACKHGTNVPCSEIKHAASAVLVDSVLFFFVFLFIQYNVIAFFFSFAELISTFILAYKKKHGTQR